MTLIYFLLVLGIIIFVHELGHFIFAKIFKVYVYEFSLGMGPRIFHFKRKNDETEYSIRVLPIGGYVKIAGEDDSSKKDVKEENKLTSKSWIQRFIILSAGSLFNFIFAFIILFIMALSIGSISPKPYVGKILEGYPITNSGIEENDLILKVDNKKVSSYEELIITLYDKDSKTNFEIKKSNGDIKYYNLIPQKEDGRYIFGLTENKTKTYGLSNAFTNSINQTIAIIKSMFLSLESIINGKISINEFSGPIGIYELVGLEVITGIRNIIYFITYLSINVGFINLLPIPALDGGRILFLILEKIKGSKLNSKIEDNFNLIGFVLLMLLMIIVTFNDILKLGGV